MIVVRRYAAIVLLMILLVSPATVAAQTTAPAPDPNDPIQRIKEEGMKRSQVMQTLSYLSDVIGPRLTASPGMKRANEWTRDQLTKWGLQNAHLETWGPFGRGWTLKKFSAQVVEPLAIPLIAYPKAWSPGIKGTVRAEAIHLDIKSEAPLPGHAEPSYRPNYFSSLGATISALHSALQDRIGSARAEPW